MQSNDDRKVKDKNKEKEGKPFWLSKTFWVNVLAVIAFMVQYFTGWVMNPATQGLFLGLINLILRAVTKKPINWSIT